MKRAENSKINCVNKFRASEHAALAGVLILLFSFASDLYGAVVTWDGGGSNTQWSNDDNWTGNQKPGASDIATFDGTSSKNCTADIDAAVAGIDIKSSYGGVITQKNSVTVTAGSAGFIQEGGAFNGRTMFVAGIWKSTSGGFVHSSGTVTFNGAGGAFGVDSNSAPFNNVEFNDGTAGGIYELQSALVVKNDLTITSGTLDAQAGANHPINVGRNWTNNGIFRAREGTVTFDGSKTMKLTSGGTGPDKKFYNLNYSGTGTLQIVSSDLEVGNNLWMQSGAGIFNNLAHRNVIVGNNAVFENSRVYPGNGDYTVGGSWDHSKVDVFWAAFSTGEIILTGTGPEPVKTVAGGSTAANPNFGLSASNPFHNLTIQGDYETAGETVVRRALTIEAGKKLTVNGSDQVTMHSAAGNLRLKSNATLNGPGTATIARGAAVGELDPTAELSTATLRIQENHNQNIAAGTYRSASVVFENIRKQNRTFTGQAGTYTFTGNVTFQTATANQYTIRNSVNGTSWQFGGDVTLVQNTGTLNWQKGTGVIRFSGSGSGAQSLNFLGKSVEDFIIDDAGAVKQLTGAVTTESLTITAGTFDLEGQNFTSTGALSNGGTLRLQGGETVTMGAMDTDSGTVVYDGAGTYTLLALGNSYFHLDFNGTGSWQHTAALDVNGNLQILDGTLASSGQDINIAGSWTNSAGYTSGANTVTFDGADQTINGSTVFYNFTKIDSSNDGTQLKLTFDHTGTQTINGLLQLKGQDAADDLLELRAASAGSQWGLMANGTFDIEFVDVRDSDASGGLTIQHANSLDGGNNLNWGFGVIISGFVFIDEGITSIGINKTVALAVNGGTTLNTDFFTAETDAAGKYEVTASVAQGDALVAYLDDEPEKGTVATVSDGNAVSSLNLFQDHLIIRHDNAGTMTNALMAAAHNGDSDIDYAAASGDLTVSGGKELLIPAGHTFTPGGNVQADDLKVLGTANFSDVTVHGSWISETGTFSASGTVTFDSVSGEIINSGTSSFNHVQFTAAGAWTLTTTDLHALGTFQLNAGTLTVPAGRILTTDGALTIGGGALISPAGTLRVNNALVMNEPGSVLTVPAAAGSFQAAGEVILTAGTFLHSSGTLELTGAGAATLNSAFPLNSLLINKSSPADSVSVTANDLSIIDTLTIRSGELAQAEDLDIDFEALAVEAQGTWRITGGSAADPAVVTTGAGGVANAGSIIFNGSGGAASGGDQDVIHIRSSVPGAGRAWTQLGAAVFTMVDVDVQDQTTAPASFEIVVTSGTNAGNNVRWIFDQAADHFVIVTDAPQALAAGSSIDVTISARDNGNQVLLSGFEGEKSLVFSGASIAPDGSAPSASGENETDVPFGNATTLKFACGAGGCQAKSTLKLFAAESLSIDSADGSLSTAADPAFDLDLTVLAGDAARLQFIQQPAPLEINAAVAFESQPAVAVVDAFDNVVTADSATTITLTAVLASDETTVAPGALNAAKNPLRAAEGIASFMAVSYGSSGKIKLKASAQGFEPALSVELMVIASGASVRFTDVNGQERISYNIGEQIYIEVFDEDENVDPETLESVVVTVTNQATGDTEELTLEETAVDSGVFINLGTTRPNAPLPSTHGVVGRADNFMLEVSALQDVIVVEYVDDDDASDSAADSASFSQISFRVDVITSGPVTAGAPFEITVYAIQGPGGIGQVIPTFSGTADLSVNFVRPASGEKSVAPGEIALAGGVGNAALRYPDAGTIRIQAVDAADQALRGESQEIVFIPGSFSVNLITREAAAHRVGEEFEMTISALSMEGEATPNYSGQVNIAAVGEDGSAANALLHDAVASFTRGTATVTNRYDRWGRVHFSVADSEYHSATGQSDTVQFIPEAFRVSFIDPPGTRAGAQLNTYYAGERIRVTIQALDHRASVITNYGGRVGIKSQAALSMPSEYQFAPADQGSYGFDMMAFGDQQAFGVEVIDAGWPSAHGATTKEAEVITAHIEVKSTYGKVGRPIRVDVRVVDGQGRIITRDNTTTLRLIFYVEGRKLAGGSLLPHLRLPQERVLTLDKGVASFRVLATQIEMLTVEAEPIRGSVIRDVVPGTVHIGSVGGRNVRILTYNEVFPASRDFPNFVIPAQAGIQKPLDAG